MTLTVSASSVIHVARLFRRLRIKAALPVLNHVRLTVAEGSTEALLETTDLSIHLAVRVDVAGPTTSGSFTIPRRDLFDIARSVDKDSTVRFTSSFTGEEKTYQVSCSRSHNGLATSSTCEGIHPEDFPPSEEVPGKGVIMPSATLEAIRRVRPAASTDETRYVLNGVLLSQAGGGVVVATDGRRLACTTARVPFPDTILPNPVADLLLDPDCSTAGVWRGDAMQASLTFGRTTLSFKLIEGNYPNYQVVIPQAFESSCTLPQGIAPSVVTWLRKQGDRTVVLTFSPGTVHLESQEKGRPAATTSVPAYLVGTTPSHLGFNPGFLADALAMGLHTIDMIDEISPGVLTDGNTRYVLMPMRTTADSPPEEQTDGSPEPAADDSEDGDDDLDDSSPAPLPQDEPEPETIPTD